MEPACSSEFIFPCRTPSSRSSRRKAARCRGGSKLRFQPFLLHVVIYPLTEAKPLDAGSHCARSIIVVSE
jgi:hypothetical protein